jgi:xanthine dehydrogenase YagS FAD-binding subunit
MLPVEPFEYNTAGSPAEAVELLAATGPGRRAARPLAGGTDLLTMMKAGLRAPVRLVNLKNLAALRGIQEADGGLHIGALVTLDTLDRDAHVRAGYRALAEAAALTASPQLRNMGTLGGNLGQESRCVYYRNPDFYCWLKGGPACLAREGDHSHHALFTDDSPCITPHPSDPATALLALDATVQVQGPDGARPVPIAALFAPPTAEHRSLNTLGPGDVILAVTVPAPAPHTTSHYLKAMDRALWSFALVGVAVAVTWTDDTHSTVQSARIALGGVANGPRRAAAAESYLAGKPLDATTAAEAGRLALTGAAPLPDTTYKLRLAAGLVARTLLEASAIT